MKKLLIPTFLSLLFVQPVLSFELDINIEGLSYEVNEFQSLERKTQIGYINAPSFRVKTNDSRFSMQPNFRFEANIFADSEWLFLENDMFEFSYLLDSIPGLGKVKNTDLNNVKLYTDDDEINLSIDYAQFILTDDAFKLKYLEMACELTDNIQNAPDMVVESCLNHSTIKQNGNNDLGKTRLEMQLGDSFVGLEIKQGRITEDSLSFETGSLAARFGTFTVQADSLDLECEKSLYNKDITGEEITRTCLRDADIKAPKLIFNDPDLKLSGNVNVDKFTADGKELHFNGSVVNISYDDMSFLIKDLDAHCQLPSLRKDFQYGHISNGCMEKSAISLADIDLTTPDSKMELKDLKLEIGESTIMIDTPEMVYTDIAGSLQLKVLESKIHCKKILGEEISMASILKGCFDSSKLTIPKVELIHEKIDSNIEINKISIDNQRIEFGSPKGSYVLNGLENEYKGLLVGCQLDASYDMAKNLDWQSVLENCLHSSKFEMDYLIGVYNGEGFWKRFGSKLKNFGIKGVNDVKYTSEKYNGDKFELVISPEVAGFIPINVTIKGNINFNKEKSQIRIKIKKVKFYKIIPAKFFVEYILNSFVEEDSLKIDGDEIVIDL
jgi:hypothetical protein